MSEPTYEELLMRNNQLARLIVGMTDRLEDSKLELMEKAWDEGHEATREAWEEIWDGRTQPPEVDNPYTKQLKEKWGKAGGES